MLGNHWDARVYDASYGSTESGTLATTCLQDHLHTLPSANLIEVEVDGKVLPMEEGMIGALIVTPLNADARPVLRLEMGDEVEVIACPCDRDSLAVRVLGRTTDKVTIKRANIDTYGLESVVYESTRALGYMVEMTSDGDDARLLLERDPDACRSYEQDQIEAFQLSCSDHWGLVWNHVKFVNDLPMTTRAGGSIKSWKRTYVSVVPAEIVAGW